MKINYLYTAVSEAPSVVVVAISDFRSSSYLLLLESIIKIYNRY